VKDTSDKLKQASEADHRVEVSVGFILYTHMSFGVGLSDTALFSNGYIQALLCLRQKCSFVLPANFQLS
jgi:hypothetical protein